MKTNRSRYILAAEILAIALFHVVKFRQSEKHPLEAVYTQTKSAPITKPAVDNKTNMEYMLVNLVK